LTVRGLFVTGTDTGVGKTVLSAALVAAMVAAGEPVHPYKPVLTGLDEQPEGAWPADDALLASLAGLAREEVAPVRFGPALAPNLAAALAGQKLDPAAMLSRAQAIAQDGATLVVEGVGGLLVPLGEDTAVRELAAELRLAVLLAARPGLGTINHSLLSLEAARAGGLDVAAVVLSGWPADPSPMERSNRETIEARGRVVVLTLPMLAGPDPVALARAGEELPWRDWLARSG
jgi:dethiobiotin synthetase